MCFGMTVRTHFSLVAAPWFNMESIFSFLDFPGESMFHRKYDRQFSETSMNSNTSEEYMDCRVTRLSESSTSDFGSNEFISTKCQTVYKRSVSHSVENSSVFLKLPDHNGVLASSESNIASLSRSKSKRNIDVIPLHLRTPHRLQTSRKTWAFFPRVACIRCRDFQTENNNNRAVCFCKDRSLDKHHDEVWLTLTNNNGSSGLRAEEEDATESEEEEEEDDDEDEEEEEEKVDYDVDEEEGRKGDYDEVEEGRREGDENEDEGGGGDEEEEGNENYIVEEVDDSDTTSVSTTTSSSSDDDNYRSCVEVEELPLD